LECDARRWCIPKTLCMQVCTHLEQSAVSWYSRIVFSS
jgi:hypothetical protein